MTIDLRSQSIRRTVAELIALEAEVAARLEQAQLLSSGHPEAIATIRRLQPLMQTHQDQLSAYLKDTGGANPSGTLAGAQSASREVTAFPEALRELSLAFHRCALSYAMLYEMALRLYEPRLREIAPKHLKAHTDAARSTARLLPGVVARQLAEDGLLCACICPMCSIGACGCVDLGTQTLIAEWSDAAATEPEPTGFVLQDPSPDSQLARAGVQGGERLLSVDGQHVGDFWETQVAIRKHALGDEVRFLLQRGSETPREVKVRHISDYPKA